MKDTIDEGYNLEEYLPGVKQTGKIQKLTRTFNTELFDKIKFCFNLLDKRMRLSNHK